MDAPTPQPIPPLPAGAALVALVPATDDLARAARAAWEVARRAAAGGRRVALVDCYTDAPWLHVVAGEPNGDGIVDVFEYGASLSRIARPQSEPRLYFVPAGTLAPDPVTLMSNPRWRRLAAGFRHEGAVMLLFLPPECIGAIGAELDGVIAFAPDGAEAGLATTPEIQAAADGGIRLLAVLTDEGEMTPSALPRGAAEAAAETTEVEPETTELEPEGAEVAPPPPDVALEVPPEPEALAAPPARDAGGESAAAAVAPAPDAGAPVANEPDGQAVNAEAAGASRRTPGPLSFGFPPGERPLLGRMHRLSARHRRTVGGGLLLVAAAAAVIWWVARPRAPQPPAPRPAPTTAAPAPPAPSPAAAPRPADSLPYAVQVSAWTRFAQATTAGDALEARGFASMIAPLRIEGRLWYRVYAGPVPTRAAADSLRRALHAAGFDRQRGAIAARVPLSFALRRVSTMAAARAERRHLRSRGIGAFVLAQADGSYGLLAGAFASRTQAAALAGLLSSTANAGRLGPREGLHP